MQSKKKKKKKIFIAKLAKKRFLLMNTGFTISILGVSDTELHCSGTGPVTFFVAQSSHGGHISRLGGTSSDLGGERPRNAPQWRRACKHRVKKFPSRPKSFNFLQVPKQLRRSFALILVVVVGMYSSVTGQRQTLSIEQCAHFSLQSLLCAGRNPHLLGCF